MLDPAENSGGKNRVATVSPWDTGRKKITLFFFFFLLGPVGADLQTFFFSSSTNQGKPIVV